MRVLQYCWRSSTFRGWPRYEAHRLRRLKSSLPAKTSFKIESFENKAPKVSSKTFDGTSWMSLGRSKRKQSVLELIWSNATVSLREFDVLRAVFDGGILASSSSVSFVSSLSSHCPNHHQA